MNNRNLIESFIFPLFEMTDNRQFPIVGRSILDWPLEHCLDGLCALWGDRVDVNIFVLQKIDCLLYNEQGEYRIPLS